jgi:hypothetical protein
VRRDANDIDDNLDDDGGGGGVWDILPTWTEGLHNVVTLVVNLLGIHQNAVLSNGECRCRDDDDRYRRCRRTNVPNVDNAVCNDDAACNDDKDDNDNVVKRRR